MLNIVCLVVFTVLLATGQLFFKRVGLTLRDQPFMDGAMEVVRSPDLYFALGLYGVATVLWIWILSRVPLSLAYPWVGVGTVLVPLLATYSFGERVNGTFWIGAMLVALGVVLTQWGAVRP